MNDLAQTGLREPEVVNWDEAFSGSKYSAPPPALGPDGKAITYYGTIAEAVETKPDEGYLNYQVDVRIKGAESSRLRAWISTRPFHRRGPDGELVPMKGNPNKLASFLRACGLQAKPQSNSDYKAALAAVKTKTFGFTIDWEAKNKDTQESVKGYMNFPDDPSTGGKKAILKAGDVVTERDTKGNVIGTRTIQSEVLFANARLKYFQDSTPKPLQGGR